MARRPKKKARKAKHGNKNFIVAVQGRKHRRKRRLRLGVTKSRGKFYRYVRGGRYAGAKNSNHRGGHYKNKRSAHKYRRRPLPYKK